MTIDIKLQFIVEEELKKGLEKTKAKKGIAIIQNPNNGEILAMASLPNYDPAEPVKKIEYLTNNAIGNSNEPGSTFKIIVLAAVLQQNLFKLSDKINCENGSVQYAGKPITDHEKQRIITVQQILERSSNVGTAKLAIKLGEEKVLATELLFNPSLNNLKYLSFQEMIINSVNGFDIQLRRNMFQNIILFGGNTKFKGIQQRMSKEIKKLAPKHTKIKILTFPKISNPVIQGGIFVSSLNSFKDMWIMKNEFLDKGYNIIHEKVI